MDLKSMLNDKPAPEKKPSQTSPAPSAGGMGGLPQTTPPPSATSQNGGYFAGYAAPRHVPAPGQGPGQHTPLYGPPSASIPPSQSRSLTPIQTPTQSQQHYSSGPASANTPGPRPSSHGHQYPQTSPYQQPPYLQYQHSQPNTPLGPPQIPQRHVSSPQHYRSLSGASNGIIAGSPAQHHPSIGNLVESPSLYSRPSPQTRRVSDHRSSASRERSLSVSPKTVPPNRPPSLGSRHSSQQEVYSARSSLQPGASTATQSETPHHVHPHPTPSFTQPHVSNTASGVAQVQPQHSQTTGPLPGPPASLHSLSPPDNRVPPHHSPQRMGMNHLLAPTEHAQPGMPMSIPNGNGPREMSSSAISLGARSSGASDSSQLQRQENSHTAQLYKPAGPRHFEEASLPSKTQPAHKAEPQIFTEPTISTTPPHPAHKAEPQIFAESTLATPSALSAQKAEPQIFAESTLATPTHPAQKAEPQLPSPSNANMGAPSAHPAQPHTSPSGAPAPGIAQQKIPLKRRAGSDAAMEPPAKRGRGRRHMERPIWATLAPDNPLLQDPSVLTNSMPSATARNPQPNGRTNGTPAGAPPMQHQHNGAAQQNIPLPTQHNIGDKPWRQDPPIDNDLLNARSLLGVWEKSMEWTTPISGFNKAITAWLWQNLEQNSDVGMDPREGTIEIEAKIGTLLNNDNERIQLPLEQPAVLSASYNRQVRFESAMDQKEHKNLNEFLNNATRESNQSKGRVPIKYKHTHETDSFRSLSEAGMRALPEAAHRRGSRMHRDMKLRTSTDDKTGQVTARIVKIPLGDHLHIYGGPDPYDVRISMNLEVNLDRPGLDPTLLTNDDSAAPSRKKDRMSYQHLAYTTDLTRVDVAGMPPKYELELEVDANLLRTHIGLVKNRQNNAMADIVEGFSNNITRLMRISRN